MDRLALPLRAALILLAAVACPAAVAQPAVAQPAVAQPADERLAAHAKLRAALEAGRLEEAAAQADAVVSLTEARFGAGSRELVNPLTNAGTVALRRGDLAAAETAYRRAVALIEGKVAGADRDLMRPLVGLGETWLAAGRPDEAVVVLQRAVDLARNLDGLYDPAQLDIVDPLIEGYVAIGAEAEAEREHLFAFRVAENAYGRDDPRLLDPLDRLARWRESQLRFTTARGLHARALQIAERIGPTMPLAGVPAMRGLSRTWLGEAVYGPEVADTMAPEMTGGGGDPFAPQAGRFSPDGERLLRYAVELIRATAPVDQSLLGETLAQLGDWYLLAGTGNRAAAAYAEAWKALVAAGPGRKGLLEQPRRLIYRAPPSSAARLVPSDPEEYTARDVDLLLRVGRDGKVLDARLPDGSEPDAVARSVVFAARKARYAPRIEAGVPVETDGVAFRERMLVKVSRE